METPFTNEQVKSLVLSYQNFKNAISGKYDDGVDDFINYIDEKIDELRDDCEGEA